MTYTTTSVKMFNLKAIVEAKHLLWKICCTVFLIDVSILLERYRVFSHDVTAAMLVSQNKEMEAMLVS